MSPRRVALVLGMALDGVLGDPRHGHPVAAFGRIAARVERRVWAPRRRAGTAYAACLVAAPAVACGIVERRLRRRPAARALFLASVVWTCVGGRSLGREARALADLVERGDRAAARRRIRSLAGRDPQDLDGPGLCRAAVESVAENTADAVIGPLVWGSLAGAAGAAAYRAANTLDAMVGHRSPRHERFGWAAARLDDVLTWPAARLGAALACALAPAVGGCPRTALRAVRRDAAGHPSPNAGPMEAAFAGALGVRLGGPVSYGGRHELRPPLGSGDAPGPADVRRAVRLSQAVALSSAALAVAVSP